MASQPEPSDVRKAAYDQLPRAPVRYVGAQFERANPDAEGIAKVEQVRKLLHEAAEARLRLLLLLRKKGELKMDQQTAWDSDIKTVKDGINQANDIFSIIAKPKNYKLRDVGEALAYEERSDATELLNIGKRMLQRSQAVQGLGKAAASQDNAQVEALWTSVSSNMADTTASPVASAVEVCPEPKDYTNHPLGYLASDSSSTQALCASSSTGLDANAQVNTNAKPISDTMPIPMPSTPQPAPRVEHQPHAMPIPTP